MRGKRALPIPVSGMLEAKRPTGAIVATILAVVLLYGCLLGLGITYQIISGTQSMPPWMTVVVFGSVIVLVFVWVRVKEGRSVRSLGFAQRDRALGKILRGAGLGVGLVALSMVVLVALGQGTMSWNGGALGTAGWVMAVVWLAIFAVQGSAEEILLRGFVTQAYARRFGLIAAIVMQAILFAVLHSSNDGMGVVPVLNLLLVAVLLGVWSVVDGSLWGVCAFHACWNWAQSDLFGTAVSGQGGTGGVIMFTPASNGSELLLGGDFGLESSLIVAIVLAAMIALYVKPLRRALARLA